MAKPSESVLIATACIALVAAIWFAGAFAFLGAAPLAESIGSRAHSVRLAIVAFAAGATVCVLSLGLNLWWLLRRWRRECALKQRAHAELAAETERSSATLSSVSATCHEIRTPVHSILGFSDLLRASGLDEVQSFHLDSLRRSANHLLDIVNDGLTGSDRFCPRPARRGRVDLDGLLGEARAMTAAMCAEAGRRIHTSRDPRLPRHIEGDAVQILQVLLNLTGNAAKYAPVGRIDISASQMPGGEQGFVRFDVLDEGPGVPEPARTGLFAGGRTVDLYTPQSCGLGLAISKTVVQAMRGEIGFEPRRPRGSQFWFTIPLAVWRETPAPAADARLQILIADDASSSLALMGELLRRRGHRVTAVTNGAWAVRAASTLRYDLIFLDVRMTGLGGVEAAEQIRRLPEPYNGARIYALSGMTDAQTRSACAAAGMDGCLAKPLLSADLDRLLASSCCDRQVEEDVA